MIVEQIYEKYVGAVLDGRYKIEKIIGMGGMAVVFKAQDTRSGRQVALKLLREDIAQEEESVKRFINETKAVAMLSHPNIGGAAIGHTSGGLILYPPGTRPAIKSAPIAMEVTPE